jgi:hypothetical protein
MLFGIFIRTLIMERYLPLEDSTKTHNTSNSDHFANRNQAPGGVAPLTVRHGSPNVLLNLSHSHNEPHRPLQVEAAP